MLLSQIEEETIRRHADIVRQNLDTLAEYAQGTKFLWQMFRDDSRVTATLSTFEFVPVSDFADTEIRQMSKILGMDGLDVSKDADGGGGESGFKESFSFIEWRAHRLGESTDLAEQWSGGTRYWLSH